MLWIYFGICTINSVFHKVLALTARKMKFPIKNFCSKCDQIRRKMQILSHLLKKSLMENFIFCVVSIHIINCYIKQPGHVYVIIFPGFRYKTACLIYPFSLPIFSECCGKLVTAMKFLYVSSKNQREALVTDYIRSDRMIY